MASDNELSGAIVREYFIKNSGRVKRDDLFDHFRSQLDKFDDQGSSKNRFGDIVNSIASLQNIEGEKYFVLKKTKTTPVLVRRQARQVNHRKDKGVSLPASMRNFRFSAAEDAFGNIADYGKIRPSTANRARAGFKSESSAKEAGLRRNNSDTSITENGQSNDSGVDTAVSSLQSESPRESRQSSFSKGSEYDRLSQNSGDTGISNEDDHYEHDVPSHVLTSFEKSWMMSAMTGNKTEIICQLEEDHNIVSFKDFIMTALHWAAKQGNVDLVRLLVNGGANINIKSGYTPLHLATMHGKVDIINLLIDEYHANVHIRDHSGKEPKDVVTKNSSEQIKQKLTDPRAAFALEEMAKKLPAIVTTDNSSGFSRYLEPKDSPKLKPKLKAGASFRFLKKQKKVRRSDRPVIEHWDSTKQERLQSTMESGEKELYNMQRSNSGSLFPNLFYSAKRQSQSEQGEEKPADIVDSSAGLDSTSEEQRQRLHSRSYPENEFRNLAQISESDPQESRGDHRSPLGSSAVDQNVLGGRRDSTPEAVFQGDKIKRRSYSDNNLDKHASFQDELATRLTMNGPGDTPPTVFTKDSSNLNNDEDAATLKIDSNPFPGNELSTFMTVPSKSAGVDTQRDGESMMNGSVPGFGRKSAGKATREVDDRAALVSSAESKPKEPFLTYKDEYSTTLSFPNQHEQQQAKMKEDSEIGKEKQSQEWQQQQQIQIQEQLLEGEEKDEVPHVYHDDKVIPKFNNNYKQVSEILTTEEHNEATQEEPTSPVRPPRRKDKKQGDDYEQNIYDFVQSSEHVLNSTYQNSKQDGVLASFVTDKDKEVNIIADYDTNTKVSATSRVSDDTNSHSAYKGNDTDKLERTSQSSNSLTDNRMQGDIEQVNKYSDHTKLKSKGVLNRQSGLDQELSQEYHNQDYMRPNSSDFAVHRANSDENMFDQYSQVNTRRKSEGFHDEKISREEFLKPAPEHVRRKSEGFTGQRRTSEGQRGPEGFTDQRSKKDFTGMRKPEGLTNQRNKDITDNLRSEDFEYQRRSKSFTEKRKSEGFTNQRRPEDFTSQKEVSLDHPRRRTIHNPPRTKQTESRHVLPEVLLDTSRSRATTGYPKGSPGELEPMRDSRDGSNRQVEQRVPPPYRPPPPGLLRDPPPENQQGSRRPSTRPNYMPPPPPGAKAPPPNQKSHEFEDFMLDPRHPLPKVDPLIPAPRPNELLYHSSENISKNTRSPTAPPPIVSPTAPPRKHRRSVTHSSEDIDYPPPELSPTAPPRKHRGSVHHSSEDIPTTSRQTSGPSYPPPSLPSNVPPPRPKSQMGEDNRPGREVSLDHPKRRSRNQDDNDVIVASGYYPSDPNDFQSQSSNYRQSDTNDFQSQSSNYHQSDPNHFQSHPNDFQSQSSNYRQSDPNDFMTQSSNYRRSDPNDFMTQSSNYRQSDPNDFQTQSSNYRQSDPNDFQSQSSNYRQSDPNDFMTQSSNYRQSDPNDFQTQSSNYRQSDPNDSMTQSSNYRQSDPNDFMTQSSNYRQSDPNDFQSQSSNYRQSDPNDSMTQSSNYRQSDPNDFQTQSSNYRQSDPNDSMTQSSNYRQSDPNDFQSQSSNYRQSDPNDSMTQSSNYRQSDPNDFRTQSSNYRQSDPNDFQSQSSNYRQSDPNDFQTQSSNYRQSDPNDFQTQSSNYYQSDPNDFQTQSSSYRQSDPNEYYPSEHHNSKSQSSIYRQSDSKDFLTQSSNYHQLNPNDSQSQSSNYRQSDPNKHYSSEYNNLQSQSSNYQQSDPSQIPVYPSDSSFRHTSAEPSPLYQPESSRFYPLEYSSDFEPTVARDRLHGNESPSLGRRSAVDTTTRDQSPPEDVVLARSITSEPERYPGYPGAFRYDEREPVDYNREPPEINREGYNIDRRNGTFAQSEGNRYENEFETVIVPKYDGYTETSISRPDTNLTVQHEPGIIVAKQMPSYPGVTEARPVTRGSREDIDSGALREDMKNKWISSSSDGSNESSENRNKYRMTSII